MALRCWHPEVLGAKTSQMTGVGEGRVFLAVLSVLGRGSRPQPVHKPVSHRWFPS